MTRSFTVSVKVVVDPVTYWFDVPRVYWHCEAHVAALFAVLAVHAYNVSKWSQADALNGNDTYLTTTQ